ncbi:phospholipase D family protein [Lactobacillus kefiranofaciens]|uniref:phospholipase D family protein n=1 Tax=Lactobacillus kefiranofaciens TaxID=267818 RepID=UPI002468F2F1|nr:phospholipase D family protein [Lactobacillus kefiranofaciens]MDH5099731.1 phospholipase D family protein [Lactobacillus kefiranofaciens]
MPLNVLDHPQKKLISNANFWQLIDQQCHENNFTNFKGISFVSSIKFIETYLLPHFSKITLILGLSDNGQNSIGKRIDQLLNKRKNIIEYSYKHPTSEFTTRLLDGSLELLFTKNELIHTKFYQVSNSQRYAVFSGSMNLTQAALSQNMEQLILDYGSTADPLFQSYQQLFNNNLQHATTYINSKKLAGYLKAKDTEELQIHILHDSSLSIDNNLNSDKKDIVILPAEEIKKYREQYSKDDEFKKLSEKEKLTVTQAITLFGDGGHKRRKLDTIGRDLYTLTQKITHQDQKQNDETLKINREVDLFPKPALFYNNGQLFQAAKIGNNIPSQVVSSTLTNDQLKDALQLFCDIVHEYNTYKDVGEGWQACDFMLFLYESPWLWKIRNLYELSNSNRSREDVPIAVALIGQGRTGKSTLGKKLAAKLIGAHNFLDSGMLDSKNYVNGKSNINMTITTTLSDYVYSNGPVSPLMIDDVSPDLTTRTYFERFIKEVTNNRNLTHPLPTFIFTMNRRESSIKSQFSLKTEMMRRLWYLSFESTFSGNNEKREEALNSLFNRANDDLFKYCQVKLAEFFANVSSADAKEIEKDYLYPIKSIIKIALKKFEIYDQIDKYFSENYDYSLFVGRNDWAMLINQAETGKDIIFTQQNDRLKAQVNKQLFNKVSDSTARNSGSMLMERYFQYLPPKYHISSQQTSTGFIIDIKNFDKWLGNDTLMTKYQNSDKVRAHQQQDAVIQMAKATTQMTEMGKQMSELNKKLMDQEQKKKHHSWFGNFFHK